MNILVTGGAGYIGSLLVPYLIAREHLVTVIDNFMYGQQSLLEHIHNERLTVVNDSFDPDIVDLRSYDAIVHLACITGAPACDKNIQVAHETNLNLVRRLTKLALPSERGARLIYPCTNSGYGIGQKSIECDEDSPLKPVSHYGNQKVEAEKYVLTAGGVSLRFATLFGISPRMRLDLLVNDFVYRALHDRALVLFESHFKRNYIHARDAVRSIGFAIMNYEAMQGRAFNVGLSDANLSKRALAEKIKEHLPDTAIIECETKKDVDKRNYIVSNKRIEALGFKPRYSLDDGIKELIRGYQIVRRTQFTNA